MTPTNNLPQESSVDWTSFHAYFWAIRLPTRLYQKWPAVADAIADGGWLLRWPWLAAFTPYIAFAIGFFGPLSWFEMRMPYIYSESLWFMASVVICAIVSGSMGVMILVGYICGDLFWGGLRMYTWSIYPSSVGLVLIYHASRILGYVLLALPAWQLPRLARHLSYGLLMTISKSKRTPLGWQITIYSLTCGGLLILWCLGMTVLIRPVFTWMGRDPTVEAVAAVQQQWYWLTAAAVTAAIVRVTLEHIKMPQTTAASPVTEELRDGDSFRRDDIVNRKRRSSASRVVFTTSMLTFILSGLYVDWLDPIMVFILTGLLILLQTGSLARFPAAWVNLMQRVPALLRFGAVPIIGYFMANQLIEQMWHWGSLRPVLIATLGTLVVHCVLFPATRTRHSSISEGVNS